MGSLRSGDRLPQATIRIDGKFEDWKQVPPAFSSSKESTTGATPDYGLHKVYVAVDGKNLYMRFDIKSNVSSTFQHPHNFDMKHDSSYGLHLEGAGTHVFAHVSYNNYSIDSSMGANKRIDRRWYSEIALLVDGYYEHVESATCSFSMKGSFLEASFPLEGLRKALGPSGAVGDLAVTARSAFADVRDWQITRRADMTMVASRGTWKLVEGSGDTTESKLLPLFGERPGGSAVQGASPAPVPPAEEEPPGLLRTGDRLPRVSISIDGDFDDWEHVPPAFFGSKATRSGIGSSFAINRVYLAVDEKNLYMRFDIASDAPSDPLHPHNFDMDHDSLYGLDLENGGRRLMAQVGFSNHSEQGSTWVQKAIPRWYLETGRNINGRWDSVESASTGFAMRGSSLEAAFPLYNLRVGLGTAESDFDWRVTARSGYIDVADWRMRQVADGWLAARGKWEWVEGSGETSETRQFAFFEKRPGSGNADSAPVTVGTDSQVPTSLSNDALIQPGSPAATLRSGDHVPQASIRINGKFDDWKGILPAFSARELSRKEVPANFAIDEVFLAMDKKNLYLRFDIMDGTPTTIQDPHNFDMDHNSSYGIELDNSGNRLVAHVSFDNYTIDATVSVNYRVDRRWYVEILRLIDGQWEPVGSSSGSVSIKGSSLEASFPLESLRKAVGVTGQAGSWTVTARSLYAEVGEWRVTRRADNKHVASRAKWRWVEGFGDRTETKQFVF